MQTYVFNEHTLSHTFLQFCDAPCAQEDLDPVVCYIKNSAGGGCKAGRVAPDPYADLHLAVTTDCPICSGANNWRNSPAKSGRLIGCALQSIR